MFNVLAGEIRKFGEKLDAFENSRGHTEDALFKRVSVLTAQGSVNCEKIDSIESQLTALRAEADKGRETESQCASVHYGYRCERAPKHVGFHMNGPRSWITEDEANRAGFLEEVSVRKKKQERKRGRK